MIADGAGIASCIQVLNTNLSIVHVYFEQEGTFDKIDNNLKNAKNNYDKMG